MSEALDSVIAMLFVTWKRLSLLSDAFSQGALVNAASNAGFEASIFDEDGGETIVLQVGRIRSQVRRFCIEKGKWPIFKASSIMF